MFCLMRRTFALFLPILALLATPVMAQEIVYETFEEEVVADSGGDRFVETMPVPVPKGIASFGPFRVLDHSHAALVDVTDERSPLQFAAMMQAYPALATLEMVECPGTFDDRANLRLGRMIHARGMATHVPDGGSVRSGAVELFLAGAQRLAEPGAEFAVHSWADESGREPRDYAANSPENRAYLDYYREMGMTPGQAAAFYAMTNSVPNADAKWMTAADMAKWVPAGRDQEPQIPAHAELVEAPSCARTVSVTTGCFDKLSMSGSDSKPAALAVLVADPALDLAPSLN